MGITELETIKKKTCRVESSITEMKNSGELSIRISVESRSIESIPSEEKENYWLKWTECQIPGTISDVYACANWVPEEKKDKEAGKNTWNSKKKKNLTFRDIK